MRILRSLICASIALMAMSLCASMPASASVPIDPAVMVSVTAGKDYPAPVALALVDEAIVQAAEGPNIESAAIVRSPHALESLSFIINGGADSHLIDLKRRC